MTGSKEELRPCPFCGFSARVDDRVFVECTNDGCNMNGNSMYQISEWNSANCWKEIDRLTARIKELEGALEKFKNQWESFGKRQHELLVEGQDLKSASKNWDEFPEAFSFDFEPLLKALAKKKGEK